MLNDFVKAKYKGEATIVLEQIDKSEFKLVADELVRRMSKNERSLGQDIDYENDSFIHPNLVLSLYKLGVDLSNTYLPRIDMRNKKLDRICLSGAILSDAKLQGSSLRKAIFDDAYLEDTDFDGADIFEAKFRNASLIRTVFTGIYNHDSADFTGADIREPIGMKMSDFGR